MIKITTDIPYKTIINISSQKNQTKQKKTGYPINGYLFEKSKE